MSQPMLQQTPPGAQPAERHGWWKVETGPDESVDALQDQFRAIFEAAGSPAGAALFCDHVLRDCPTLLFTPRWRGHSSKRMAARPATTRRTGFSSSATTATTISFPCLS